MNSTVCQGFCCCVFCVSTNKIYSVNEMIKYSRGTVPAWACCEVYDSQTKFLRHFYEVSVIKYWLWQNRNSWEQFPFIYISTTSPLIQTRMNFNSYNVLTRKCNNLLNPNHLRIFSLFADWVLQGPDAFPRKKIVAAHFLGLRVLSVYTLSLD